MTLSETPPPANRLDAIDAVRAVAALMVYWNHTGTALVFPPLIVYGSSGVYLFFVLSGYLLYRPFAAALAAGRPLPAAGPFYLRRAVRIWPPYLVCLALFAAVRYATGLKPPDGLNLAAHAALVFNYIPQIDFYSINGVFWTLALEAQFYLLLPPLVWLAAWATRRRRPAVRAAAAPALFVGLGIAGRALEGATAAGLYGADTQVVYRSVFSYLDLFGYGMIVSLLERPGWGGRSRWRAVGWAVGSLGLVVAANNLAHYGGGDWVADWGGQLAMLFPPLIGLGMACLLAAALTPAVAASRLLNNAPLRFVGRISYSVYLYHIGVQFFLLRFVNLDAAIGDFYLRGLAYGAIFLAPTLAVSAVMFWLVERPCLGLIARRRERQAAP